MDDLFERLKSEPAANCTKRSPSPEETKAPSPEETKAPSPEETKASSPEGTKTPSPVKSIEAADINKIKIKNTDEHRVNNTENKSISSSRRDSMPPPTSTIVVTKKTNKSRSMSPISNYGAVRPFKVLVERKNFDEFLLEQKRSSTFNSNDSTNRTKNDAPHSPIMKSTPTKAQQKLFDPIVLEKVQQNNEKKFKLRRCLVRIKRENLENLQKEQTQNNKKKNAKKSPPKPQNVSPKTGEKRIASSEPKSAPSLKKSRTLSPTTKKSGSGSSTSGRSSFIIKLPTKLKLKSSKLNQQPAMFQSQNKKEQSKDKFATAKTKYLKANSAMSKSSTKPTKFTRTQLIKAFGKRCFRSYVRIERCKHPLMLIFESNARARKLQSKRNNKSKNLSVSFKEQVEIFGDSDSETDTSLEEANVTASTSQAALSKLNNSSLQIVTPTRLKKVENGKVVDDIEFDTSLFIDPSSSTPYASPARRKREKKSFSPLKDDLTQSPRKEQLRLADEKLPPSGLRRLHIDPEDEDDEDDDCEYIVPIEIPQRRASNASSNLAEFSANVGDSSNITSNDAEAVAETERSDKDATASVCGRENLENNQNDSSETFVSAEDQPISIKTFESTNEIKSNTQQQEQKTIIKTNDVLEGLAAKENSEEYSKENNAEKGIENGEGSDEIPSQMEKNCANADAVDEVLAINATRNETKENSLEYNVPMDTSKLALSEDISLRLYVEEEIFETSERLNSVDIEEKTTIE